MHKIGLWIRWSWRDLRDHWLQVAAIALIIALGIGVYAGLGSTTPWRLNSADQSYDLLNMYDLRIRLTSGSYLDQNALLNTLSTLNHANWITGAEERLIEPLYVQATKSNEPILVRGRVVSVNTDPAVTSVNAVYIERGRALPPDNTGQLTGILEYHFADYYDLPAQGTLQLGGNRTLDYVGQGFAPEYFMVNSPEGGMWAQSNFAVVFTSLATAQTLTDHPGKINDALLTLAPHADRALLRAELETAIQTTHPQTGFTVLTREDGNVYDLVYRGAHINQEIYDIIAIMFLAGAMFGAFNLASRLVEAQRRQIGIGMALGVAPQWLAIRPVLVGIQIAVLGTIMGLLIGLGMGQLTTLWINTIIPMPVSARIFYPETFVEGMLLGIMLPLIATLYPVWRAVRIPPVDAIQTGHLVAKGGGLAPLVPNHWLPGKSFVHIPIRNLLRAPRRALLTILGLTSAIITLVGLVGILDTALRSIAVIEGEMYQAHPTRQIVYLNNFYAADSDTIQAIQSASVITQAEPTIRVTGQAQHGSAAFDIMLEVLDLTNDVWAPSVVEGSLPTLSGAERPGILISTSAAQDLGIGVGDTFTLVHPHRTGLLSYEMQNTEVRVTGLHPDPYRFNMYLPATQADLLGIEGLSNVMHIIPAPNVSISEVRQVLFAESSVASVIAVTDSVDSLKGALREVIRFLSGVQIAVIVLAFLIAFNSTTINLNERAREVATMFAFGVPIRTVTRMAMIENAITGCVGTVLGIIAGRALATWFYVERMPEIVPEMRFDVTLSNGTMVLAIVIGVGVVALTPLLAMRRMAAMDIPSTLRVME